MNDKRAKILIVEDDLDLQEAYAMILSSQGYEVQVANDGMEALNALGNFVPDVILLDYFMPRMDGKNFLENFDQSKFKSTEVIVASNISDTVVLEGLIALGASKCVLKADLSPTDLINLIEEYV